MVSLVIATVTLSSALDLAWKIELRHVNARLPDAGVRIEDAMSIN